MSKLKTLDKDAIIANSLGKKVVLTYENHNVETGLGTRVASLKISLKSG